MKVAFRADASFAIGTGHVMRCLALADALRAHRTECLFLSRDHAGSLHQLVQARGYPLLNLGTVNDLPAAPFAGPYAQWLGVDPQRDSEDVISRLAGQSVDWLVVDHYSLGVAWERTLRPACGRLMAVDDLANRPHAVDLLLDQNLGNTESDYKSWVSDSCELMLGPRYALLRPEFAALRSESLSRRAHGRLRKLLITMGGVDLENATGAVLEALSSWWPSSELEVTVVMGPNAPSRELVIQQAQHLPFHTEVLVNVQCMGVLMRDADLAIGAAGSTAWERCCLGLPTLQLVLAENQCQIANALSKAGAAHLLDRAALLTSLSIEMDNLVGDPELLLRMSSAAAKLVDGRGAERVALYLKEGRFE